MPPRCRPRGKLTAACGKSFHTVLRPGGSGRCSWIHARPCGFQILTLIFSQDVPTQTLKTAFVGSFSSKSSVSRTQRAGREGGRNGLATSEFLPEARCPSSGRGARPYLEGQGLNACMSCTLHWVSCALGALTVRNQINW